MRYLHMVFFDEHELDALLRTMRARSRRVSVTDGPFAETNEQVG
jgi:hypothetical protein